MCEACDSTKREIGRLAEWKGRLDRHRATIDKEIKRLKEWKKKIEGQCGAKPRKQYFKKYYAANRAKKIEAAKERYLSQRSRPQRGDVLNGKKQQLVRMVARRGSIITARSPNKGERYEYDNHGT